MATSWASSTTSASDRYRAAVTDEELIELALAEASNAPAHGDVPVGAVVAVDGRVDRVGADNEREHLGDPTAHAEMLAMRDAAEALGEWRLSRATLAATLEPCPMCAGAAQSARVARVVFGADDPKSGACGSLYNLGADPRLNHEYEVVGGVRGAQCAGQLADFFAELRTGPTG